MGQNKPKEHVCCSQVLICTFKNCMNEKRLLCSQCSNHHQHKQVDQQHLIEISKFWNFISDNIEPNTKPMKQLKQTLQQININSLVQNELVTKLLNIKNIKESKLLLIQEQLDLILSKQRDPESIIQQKQNLNQQDQQLIKKKKNVEQKLKKYDSIYESSTKNWFSSSSISKQEQYLAYSEKNGTINLINIKTKKKVKKQYLEGRLDRLQFSESNLLYSGGLFKGTLYCFKIQSSFKLIRKIETQKSGIYDLRVIKDRVIIAYRSVNTIVVYDVSLNITINKVYDTNYINWIDYDYNNQIVVCSGQHTIKFFNNFNQTLINHKEPALDLCPFQIQLLNSCKNLLAICGYDTIKLWEIAYDRKCLNLLKQKKIEMIQYFQSISEDTKIVIITLFDLQILDSQFNKIYKRDHCICQTQDIKGQSSMNYVVVTNSSKYISLIKIEQIRLFKKS